MIKYEYQRNKLSKGYDLENTIEDISADERRIHPAYEIEQALPNKKFVIFGEDTILKCRFENELSIEEKATLDAIIEASRKQE